MTGAIDHDVFGLADPAWRADPAWLSQQLSRHGYLWLRGAVAGPAALVELSSSFGGTFLPYRGGAVQREADGDATTFLINSEKDTGGSSLHGEQYYLASPPRTLWFYCQRPAYRGGETLVCDGRALYQQLPGEVRDRCRDHRLVYRRWFTASAWRDVVGDLGASPPGWRVERHADGTRFATFACSGLTSAPDGRPAFVNSVLPILFDFDDAAAAPGQRMEVGFEAGPTITRDLALRIQEAATAVQRHLPLRAGDVLVIDNRWVLHGRTPFSGPRRMYGRMEAPPHGDDAAGDCTIRSCTPEHPEEGRPC